MIKDLRAVVRIKNNQLLIEDIPALQTSGAVALIEGPEETFEKTEMRDAIRRALSTLTPREEEVLKRRTGLEGREPQTLEQIGNDFGITRERIREIESKALRKLRHPSRAPRLKQFHKKGRAVLEASDSEIRWKGGYGETFD